MDCPGCGVGLPAAPHANGKPRKWCSIGCLQRTRRTHKAGDRIGRLVVLDYLPSDGSGTKVTCRCDCGTVRDFHLGNLKRGITASCGCLRRENGWTVRGASHQSWKGGRRTDPDGYVHLRDSTHPNRNHSGEVLEHVAVMSEMLGRALRRGETVHHRNGIRDDNRPANLELWIRTQPAGRRVTDLVAFAREVLATYEEDAHRQSSGV